VRKRLFYNNTLLGVRILGMLNFFVFGLLFLLIFLSTYFNTTAVDLSKMAALLKQNGISVILTLSQLKIASIFQSIIATGFIVSGAGLLLKEEWARKWTLIFAFFLVALALIAFAAHPSFIRYLFLQILYPGILIMYFTHKNVVAYFIQQKTKENQDKLTD